VAPHVHLHVEHAHTYLTNRQGLLCYTVRTCRLS
jgi:hypothetical protein